MPQPRPDNEAPAGARQPEINANVYFHAIDGANRLILPSEWRPMIGVKETMLVLPDPYYKSLNIFMPEFTREIQKTIKDKMGILSFGVLANLAKVLLTSGENIEMDQFGRIRICDKLLFTHAGVTKNVKLEGGAGVITLTAIKTAKPGDGADEPPEPVEKVNPVYVEALIKFGLMEEE